MSTTFYIVFTLGLCLLAVTSQAQPTDAQVIQQIKNPGVLSVKLTPGRGKKVWSSAHSQYFWERAAIVYRNAKIPEYPNAKVEIGGFARYDIIGGRFSYREFKVTWNSYLGIPVPSDNDILEMVQANLEQFVGNATYNQIVSEIENLQLAAEKNSEWHTPNSFSIDLSCSYDRVVSYTEVAKEDVTYRVRFYRDAVKSPWKPNFISSRKTYKELSKTKFSAEEIRAMPSLGSRASEQKAQAAMSGLPEVNVPSFNSDTDLFLFVHNILLTGTKEEFHAMMMHLMAPNYFIEGSKVQLNQRGADLINQNIRRAYEGKSTYAEQYCADPGVKHKQTNMIQFFNKSKQVYTRIAIGKFGGRFERGVRVDQEYKITDLSVGILTRQVDLEYMNSFPDDELCGNTPPPAQQGAVRTSTRPGTTTQLSGKSIQPVATDQVR